MIMSYLLGDQHTEWTVIRHTRPGAYKSQPVNGKWGESRDVTEMIELAATLSRLGFASVVDSLSGIINVACDSKSHTLLVLSLPNNPQICTSRDAGPKGITERLLDEEVNGFVKKGVRVLRQHWLDSTYQEVTELQ